MMRQAIVTMWLAMAAVGVFLLYTAYEAAAVGDHWGAALSVACAIWVMLPPRYDPAVWLCERVSRKGKK